GDRYESGGSGGGWRGCGRCAGGPAAMSERFTVTYRVRGDAASIEVRAQGIAVEQSVEMPLAAIDDPAVLTGIVGLDGGQFLNMLFGNTSLHDDVTLWDVDLPTDLVAAFGGPRHGIAELRRRLRLPHRAMTGSALKPQGLPNERLALLAERFARGGLDFVKDDHGLADQSYSRFAARVTACAAGVARGGRATGHPTRYVPSLTGNLDQMRRQAILSRNEGLDCVMLAPMICGFPAMQALVAEFPDMAFFAHPSLGGAARIAPDLLIGKLFRLMVAGAVI